MGVVVPFTHGLCGKPYRLGQPSRVSWLPSVVYSSQNMALGLPT